VATRLMNAAGLTFVGLVLMSAMGRPETTKPRRHRGHGRFSLDEKTLRALCASVATYF
jgi:hypothetical protein